MYDSNDSVGKELTFLRDGREDEHSILCFLSFTVDHLHFKNFLLFDLIVENDIAMFFFFMETV